MIVGEVFAKLERREGGTIVCMRSDVGVWGLRTGVSLHSLGARPGKHVIVDSNVVNLHIHIR